VAKVSAVDAPCGPPFHDLHFIPRVSLNAMELVCFIAGCMSIKRSHLQSSPLCLIYFHMTSVCRYQTPRIESCCAYGGRGGRFDPPFLFGWALLVHRIDILRSDATIFTRTSCSNSFVLRMPVSTQRLCLESQFRIFPSFKQRTFFFFPFFLCNEVNVEAP
jgi:hypothetical protein